MLLSNQQASEMMRKESQSERLIASMLPKEIIKEINRSVQLQYEPKLMQLFPETTVLFFRISDFSDRMRTLRPKDVVFVLNALWTRFDALVSLHSVYKVGGWVGGCAGEAGGEAVGGRGGAGEGRRGEVQNREKKLRRATSSHEAHTRFFPRSRTQGRGRLYVHPLICPPVHPFIRTHAHTHTCRWRPLERSTWLPAGARSRKC